MESRKIAIALQELKPEPPLRINIPDEAKFFDCWTRTASAIVPDFMPKVATRLLSDASLPYFHSSREAMFGMTLEQVEKQLGGAKAYEQAKAPHQELTEMYKENTEGVFLMGNEVCFCDVVWASTLHGLRIIGEDDVFNMLLNTLGEDRKVHDALLEAAAPWLVRDHW